MKSRLQQRGGSLICERVRVFGFSQTGGKVTAGFQRECPTGHYRVSLHVHLLSAAVALHFFTLAKRSAFASRDGPLHGTVEGPVCIGHPDIFAVIWKVPGVMRNKLSKVKR